jgi:hypothetical protein
LWDIIYAFDYSESMGKEQKSRAGEKFRKIDEAVGALTAGTVTAALPPSSRVAVIGYMADEEGRHPRPPNERVRLFKPLTPLDDFLSGIAELRERLISAKCVGATPAGSMMEASLNLFYEKTPGTSGVPPTIKRLIVVTDEYSNIGPEPAEVLRRGGGKLILDVAVIGSPRAQAKWSELAKLTGGKCTLVDGASELARAMTPDIPPPPNYACSELLTAVSDYPSLAKEATDPLRMEELARVARDSRSKLSVRLAEVKAELSESRKRLEALLAEEKAKPRASMSAMSDYAKAVWPEFSRVSAIEDCERRLRDALDKLGLALTR